MEVGPVLAQAAETGVSPLLGWAIVGAGVLDVVLAGFLALFRRPSDPRAPNMLPLILALSGVGMLAIGAAILLGLFG